MNMDQSEKNSSERPGPLWDRITLYAPWLVVMAIIVNVGPMFRPIFAKIQEIGGLPTFAALLFHFDKLNEAWYHAPAIVLSTGFVLFNETVLAYLGRRANGRLWCTRWSNAMFLAGLLTVFGLPYGLLLPVTKVNSAVEASRNEKATSPQQAIDAKQIFDQCPDHGVRVFTIYHRPFRVANREYREALGCVAGANRRFQ
jgi:hypothetical protein